MNDVLNSQSYADASFFVLPIIVSTSFLLIADIESPREGIIRIRPPNLLALSQSLEAQSVRNDD